MQPVPRQPPSVPLGGSLRASRAAQLACPSGPLAAVDLADGRALLAELRGSLWVAVPAGEETLALPAVPAPVADDTAPVPRRRRLGTVVALAAALGAAAVVLATGLSGSPSPAVAGAPPRPSTPRAAAPVVATVPAVPRGVAAPPSLAPARPAPPPPPAPAAGPPPAAPPPAVPAPPPLPELPPAPAL